MQGVHARNTEQGHVTLNSGHVRSAAGHAVQHTRARQAPTRVFSNTTH